MGELFWPHQVLAPDLDRIQAELARRVFDDALGLKRRLGPPGATVGVHWPSVDEYRAAAVVHHRKIIGSALSPGRAAGRRKRPNGPAIGADAGDRFRAQGPEGAVVVDGKLDAAGLSPAVGVGQEAFGAVVDPFDRPAQFLGRIEHQGRFRIGAVLDPETAAHIRRDVADFLLVDAEDVLGQGIANGVDILG